MKGISEVLKLTATNANSLTFSVESTFVNISTYYKSLDHPLSQSTREPFQRDPTTRVIVNVDIKKFSKFLYSSNLNPTDVICSIIEDKALVLNVKLEDLYLTYYIPVIHQ